MNKLATSKIKVLGKSKSVRSGGILKAKAEVNFRAGGRARSRGLEALKKAKALRRAALKPEMIRYSKVLQKAIELFGGDESAAEKWLRSPQFDLRGIAPIDFVRRKGGTSEVLNLIGRLEHGVCA